MKKIISLFFCITLLFINNNLFAKIKYFKYLDPVPNAKYVNKEACIIIKPDEFIDKESIFLNGSIILTGSKGGEYTYSIIKSVDGSSIIVRPERFFILGEKITVSFTSFVKHLTGRGISPFSYSFTIKSEEVEQPALLGLVNEFNQNEIDKLLNGSSDFNERDFPQIIITYSDNPSPGYLFLSNQTFDVFIPNTPYLLILNNNGTPFFSRQMSSRIFDFNKQPNGNLTYYDYGKLKFYELNPNYYIIDSFYCGNGYSTDLHELRVLPNHHALLMSYDRQIVNMSLYISGGDTAAMVTGLIIQEIDANKNVVFQWRSWDHFQITDATHENLLGHFIDYVHGNAIEIDTDGNIMISSRHMDEITKINRTTGDIIWRLGGKNNQFTFVNDPIRFSYQHAIRRIINGNITLFDNGNYHSPPFSRAVEYSLDEANRVATLVWQYRNYPDIYGFAMGYVQRLENNNTLISWGSTNPTLTEVRYDGTKVFELTFSADVYTYRAYKYDWGNPVAISDPTNAPKTFELSQNYPNPFNPSTKIKFDLPRTLFAKLAVYDVLGREVKVLLEKQLHSGNYEIDFNAENLPSGIYFYILSAGDPSVDGQIYTQTKKMLLIK